MKSLGHLAKLYMNQGLRVMCDYQLEKKNWELT